MKVNAFDWERGLSADMIIFNSGELVMSQHATFSRRRVVQGVTIAASFALSVPALAAKMIVTPRQTTGPFYPRTLPLDSDNDLAQVQGRAESALGEITHIFGRITDPDGRALANSRVEIWQCDALGRYHHPRDGGGADPNFQGFGHTVTDNDGAYRFRTVKPVPYPGRAPHIHFGITGNGIERLTTQMYVKGHPLNTRDWLLNNVRDPRARNSLIVSLRAAPEVENGALAGNFDIVLG